MNLDVFPQILPLIKYLTKGFQTKTGTADCHYVIFSGNYNLILSLQKTPILNVPLI